ncbi:NAC domain containing protein 2 [Euphorbia peplus]|nr:NAC domain containing protein 2 [Euphorbia peplus]
MARGKKKSSASLAPGFRFHPTDEELIRYYLKRKVTNKPFRFDPIAVVDIYKTEPWDLPDKSKLKTRDLEWYFFSMLDKKYSNGSKTNRATEKGYWKTTGKDRPVRWNSKSVGMKKTLVYHLGRAPRGERSNWVMHEYRLTDEDLEKAGVVQDAFVLCRIFQKSGTGPKNGEQYGAPFVEEEWDDEELVTLLPGEEMVVTDEVALGDDAYVETDDLDQDYEVGVTSENTALPVNYYPGETSNYPEHSGNTVGVDQTYCEITAGFDQNYCGNTVGVDQTFCENTALFDQNYSGNTAGFDQNYSGNTAGVDQNYSENTPGDDQKPIIDGVETQYVSDLNGQNLFILPGQYETDAKSVRHEYIAESSIKPDAVENDYLLDEPFMDASNNPPFDEGLFLETSDLSNPVEPNSTTGDSTVFDMVDEYLNFFDANDENLSFDPSELMESDTILSEQVPVPEKVVNGGNEEVPIETNQLVEANNDTQASSSKQHKPDMMKFESDMKKYPFMKQASHMLGGIAAPPAFASEFPMKGSALQYNAAQSSSSIRVTAGMIRIENITFGGNGSFGKNGNVNIVLSFAMSEEQGSPSPASSMPTGNALSAKMWSMASWGWCLLMFFWVVILSVSFKIGTCISAKDALCFCCLVALSKSEALLVVLIWMNFGKAV